MRKKITKEIKIAIIEQYPMLKENPEKFKKLFRQIKKDYKLNGLRKL